MAPSRTGLGRSRATKLIPTAEMMAVSVPKSAGVHKPIPRAKAAKPVTRVAITRPATRAYAKKVKEEESSESSGYSSESEQELHIPPRATAAIPIARVVARALQPSALPAPSAPVNTDTELENLITIGREQVEKELKDRIKEEQEKKRLLEKQKTAFRRYQNYLTTLTDLEDELREMKEENRLDEEMVSDQAELFRRNTIKWARLFEEYAEELGITVFDIQRLSDAW